MTPAELDVTYTRFCEAMAEVGEARATQFLCRFALLVMVREQDTAAIERLIDEAREGMCDGA
jgi:hypothetical protein